MYDFYLCRYICLSIFYYFLFIYIFSFDLFCRQFSSFELPPDGEVVVITDTYRKQQHHHHQQQRPMVSPCHPQSTPVPLDMDTENVPLNLSVSNNCNNNNTTNNNLCLTSSSLVSSQQQQLRPSVITCTFTNRYYPNMNSYGPGNSPSRRELTSGLYSFLSLNDFAQSIMPPPFFKGRLLTCPYKNTATYLYSISNT